ncbi:MAG: hypothetical protein AB8B81_22275 [Halioglobus sp.]
MPAGRSLLYLLSPSIVMFWLYGSASVFAQSAPENHEKLTTENIERSLGHGKNAEDSWVDSSHQYIGTKADDLAIYLDTFFGAPLEDLESADSTVRFVTRFDWDEDDGSDAGVRLRGTVHLPRVNERLSLVFDGEDNDSDEQFDVDGNDSNEVGLQLNTNDGRHSRFDLTLKLSSGPNLKPGVRYRFKEDLSDWGRFRYTARVDYSNSKRFRHRHAVELDYLTGESSLLRWANKIEQGQRSDGVEWSSLISWRYGYNIDSALAIIGGVVGKTEPDIPDFIREDPPYIGRPPKQDSLITNYVVAFRLRNRLYKDWLYVEFEPGYSRRQRHHFEDRHGVFFARVNFEILFNRGREQAKNSADDGPASQSTPPGDGV